MNHEVMTKYYSDVLSRRGAFFSCTKSLMIWDAYGTHIRDDTVSLLKRSGINTFVIPKGFTSILQPLDVCINGPLKAALRNEWALWFDHGVKEYTAGGNRRRPSYQVIVDMVSRALRTIPAEMIRASFTLCGIAANGAEVPVAQLHSRLRAKLEQSLSAQVVAPESDGDSVALLDLVCEDQKESEPEMRKVVSSDEE